MFEQVWEAVVVSCNDRVCVVVVLLVSMHGSGKAHMFLTISRDMVPHGTVLAQAKPTHN